MCGFVCAFDLASGSKPIKEEYFYREIYEKLFPSPTAALCPPHEAGVACSTAKALEWDEAWRSSNEPSGRAISGVHVQAY